MINNQQIVPKKRATDFDNLIDLRQNLSVYMANRVEMTSKKIALTNENEDLKKEISLLTVYTYSNFETYSKKYCSAKEKEIPRTFPSDIIFVFLKILSFVIGIILPVLGAIWLFTICMSNDWLGIIPYIDPDDKIAMLIPTIINIAVCVGLFFLVSGLLRSLILDPFCDFLENFLDDKFGFDATKRKYAKNFEKECDHIYKKDTAKRKKLSNELENQLSRNIEKINTINKNIAILDNAFYSLNFCIAKDDYKYTDYIIFLFASNRVDNLKEALYRVDEERRAQQIVSAINSMKSELSNTIQRCCSLISKNVEIASQNISNTIQSSAQATQQQIKLNSEKIATQLKLTRESTERVGELIQHGNRIASIQLSQLDSIARQAYGIQRN